MICDHCQQRTATVFVTSDYAWGGNPAYGSFRSFVCEDCKPQVVASLDGQTVRVEPLRRPAEVPA